MQYLLKGTAGTGTVLLSGFSAGTGAQTHAVHPGPVVGILLHIHIAAPFKRTEIHLAQAGHDDLLRLREQDPGSLAGTLQR